MAVNAEVARRAGGRFGFSAMVDQTVDLFVRELGGSGRPLLLLHGLLGSGRNWQSAGAGLAEVGAGRTVRAVDLRNHGKSPWSERMDYDALVADVLAWMQGNTSGPVDLMGHSLGGKVAMALACRHPERVGRLVVVDIAPKAYLSHGHRAEFAAMNELRLAELRSRGEAELKMEGRVPDWGMRKFLTTNLEQDAAGAWRWLVNLPVLTAALPALEVNPLKAGEGFAGPALFLRGGRSRYVEDTDLPEIRARFPAARVETISAAAHNPHMETRAEFCAIVGAFLGGSGVA
jgi:pimeloyl-ACP methyl ester carboxylesterase